MDRIVLNAYYPLGSSSGGFRTWWRRLNGGSDAEGDAVLDNTHLMRLAGRFARRVRAWAAGNAVPVIDCSGLPTPRRYYLPGPAARTIPALLTLRDHVIAPILAGVQIRRHDHVPARLPPIDQDYEHLRTDMPPCSATWVSSPVQPRRSPLAKPDFWRSWNLKLLGQRGRVPGEPAGRRS